MQKKIAALLLILLCIVSIYVGIRSTKEIKIDDKKISKHASQIALITLDGTIYSNLSDGFMDDINSAENVRKSLLRAFNDPTVNGVLLRVNSPGGTVGMSQEIYSIILKHRNLKPVVVSMSDIAASGGYYIAAAADRIYANPGTLTGSIGVIMSTFNVKNLLNNKLEVKSEVIKSGKYKDIASPYKNMSNDERAMLQKMIDRTYGQFVDAIMNGRVKRKDKYSVKKIDLKKENLYQYADGRIFTGTQAQKLGFVDNIGGLEEAKKGIREIVQKKFGIRRKVPIVQYNSPSGLNLLFSGLSSNMNKMNTFNNYMPFSTKYPRQPLVVWE